MLSRNQIATNDGANVELISGNRLRPGYNNKEWGTYCIRVRNIKEQLKLFSKERLLIQAHKIPV